MRRSLGALGAVAILGAAVVASARLPAAPAAGSGLAKAPSPFVPAPPFASPREIVLFGHVRSLVRKPPDVPRSGSRARHGPSWRVSRIGAL